MNTNDHAEFRKLLEHVHSFYRQDLSAFGVDVWWEACRSFELADVRSALSRHTMDPEHGQYLPKPADVMRMLEGGGRGPGQAAWAKVMRAVREVGTYQTVCFDDHIINAVVHDMGGWIALGQVTEKELPFTRKQFEDRYRAYRLMSPGFPWPSCLPGIFDRDNAALHPGADSQPVVLIGDRAKAELVYEQGQDRIKLGVSTLASHAVKRLPGGRNDGKNLPVPAAPAR